MDVSVLLVTDSDSLWTLDLPGPDDMGPVCLNDRTRPGTSLGRIGKAPGGGTGNPMPITGNLQGHFGP